MERKVLEYLLSIPKIKAAWLNLTITHRQMIEKELNSMTEARIQKEKSERENRRLPQPGRTSTPRAPVRTRATAGRGRDRSNVIKRLDKTKSD
jgi:hypothetical protein